MLTFRIRTFLCIVGIFATTLSAIAPRLKIKKRLLGSPGPVSIQIDGQEKALSEKTLKNAQTTNAYLNAYNTTYFNLPLLRNRQKIRRFLRKNNRYSEQGKPFCIETNNKKVYGTFFDRKSNYLAVISGGFTNCHEYMAPFVKLFPKYDLLFFDLPGHGLEQQQAVSLKGQLAQSILGLDLQSISLGNAEAETIIAVVKHFKEKKNYKKIAGAARCYSVPFFAQAGIDWEKENSQPLFNKLILDSPFSSFQEFIPHLPLLASSRSKAPLFRDLCKSWPVKTVFTKIAEYFLEVPLQECVPTGKLLKQLTATDMLFIHSKKDIAISNADFSLLWNELAGINNKCTLFTYNPHAMNHIKQKELYKFVTEQFIEQSFTDFVQQLSTL